MPGGTRPQPAAGNVAATDYPFKPVVAIPSTKYRWAKKKIKIRRRSDQLAISVVDNGLGMTAAKLNALRDESAGANIGLFNTNKRLILTYGATAALKIRSKPGRGTVVFFQIPATEEDFATPERD